jgi:hypothetical protein
VSTWPTIPWDDPERFELLDDTSKKDAVEVTFVPVKDADQGFGLESDPDPMQVRERVLAFFDEHPKIIRASLGRFRRACGTHPAKCQRRQALERTREHGRDALEITSSFSGDSGRSDFSRTENQVVQ